MKKTLSFAAAIQYMTENPGKEVKSCTDLFFYLYDGKFVYYRDDKELASNASFTQDEVQGQWTIPEPELPEVGVEIYQHSRSGNIEIVAIGSAHHEALKNMIDYTKCKIKFNQGDE